MIKKHFIYIHLLLIAAGLFGQVDYNACNCRLNIEGPANEWVWMEAHPAQVQKSEIRGELIRFYNENNKVGCWFTTLDDAKLGDGSMRCKTDIQSRYSLPNAPLRYERVSLAGGVYLYEGHVRSLHVNGVTLNGGGRQFCLVGDLGELLNNHQISFTGQTDLTDCTQ